MREEELDQALGALGERDVGAWRRESVRLRAHEALEHPKRTGFARTYHRYVEPALVATICAIQLVWAFGAAAGVLLH